MARRMVTGALGVRLSTAKQEREAERALLKVARGEDPGWQDACLKATCRHAVMSLLVRV